MIIGMGKQAWVMTVMQVALNVAEAALEIAFLYCRAVASVQV
jgi:hypothetical protein